MSGQMMNQDQAIAASVKLTNEAHQKFSEQVSAMNGKISNIGASWQGSGAVAFDRVIAAWNDQQRRLLSALQEFTENLEGTDKVFNVTDSEAEQSLNKLTARLG